MPYYRPRMLARLSVPVWGSPSERQEQNDDASLTTFPVLVSCARWTRNDHNHADELSITLDWRDAGVDPRLLSNATVEFFLGNADERGNWEPSLENRRFLGVATEIERQADGDLASVSIKALDFTTLFIESKPYSPEGVPLYSENLEEAWKRICTYAGGKDTQGNWFRCADALSDKLVAIGVEGWPPPLSAAVAKRVAKGARVPVKAATDAWAVWQTCVGMLGLVSWIHQDKVLVTTATNLFTQTNPPVLVWGRNILSIRERRNCAMVGKKVALMSYDPLSGRVIEALWPPKGEDARKKPKASGAGKQDDYEVFEQNGITDSDVLLERAKRVYEERSRQELEGTLMTAEMFVDSVSGQSFNLLTLGAGQDIRIEIEQETLDALYEIDGESKRAAWLRDRGYSDSVAELLAKNAEGLKKLSPVFHTRSVTTTLESDETGGSYTTEIAYCNRIEVNGDAT